jgi:4-hydroxybutyrate dehydrogenase
MVPVLPLPRLVFGAGALHTIADELSLLGVRRPLLVSDRGLERAGAVASAMRALPEATVQHLDVPGNPTAAGADAAYTAYRDGGCDGVVALGGGAVLDTAKFVAALAGSHVERAAALVGKPELIGPGIAPLIAIPTTVGTGSESSPVAALHLDAASRGMGTRSPFLVPRVAICDPDLVRTLPRRLIAATGFDALSHCMEGYFAEPANPIVDALALDGLARVFASIEHALEPEGHDARAALMAAAFAGGAAIHKGLGPAHAVALACSDQDLHHGTLIATALPLTVDLVARQVPAKTARIAAALGLAEPDALGSALQALTRALDLPTSLREAGYKAASIGRLVEDMVHSPFNRTSPYTPTRDEYAEIARRLLR